MQYATMYMYIYMYVHVPVGKHSCAIVSLHVAALVSAPSFGYSVLTPVVAYAPVSIERGVSCARIRHVQAFFARISFHECSPVFKIECYFHECSTV